MGGKCELEGFFFSVETNVHLSDVDGLSTGVITNIVLHLSNMVEI